jgi:hypothetical protein
MPKFSFSGAMKGLETGLQKGQQLAKDDGSGGASSQDNLPDPDLGGWIKRRLKRSNGKTR